jgi:hypothetical protein
LINQQWQKGIIALAFIWSRLLFVKTFSAEFLIIAFEARLHDTQSNVEM